MAVDTFLLCVQSQTLCLMFLYNNNFNCYVYYMALYAQSQVIHKASFFLAHVDVCIFVHIYICTYICVCVCWGVSSRFLGV